MSVVAGKTWMDRNAPSNLLDTPSSAYDDSEKLIKKWHKKRNEEIEKKKYGCISNI